MSQITIDRSVVEQALEDLEMTINYVQSPTRREDMRDSIEALRAALEQTQGEQEPVAWAEEIIEFLHAHYDTEMIKELDSGDELIRLDDAISAVEEVAQRYTRPQPKGEQEPVVWMDADARVFYDHDTSEVDRHHGFKPTVPLYAHPQPKREPLTDEQIVAMWQESIVGLGRAVERAHGIGGGA